MQNITVGKPPGISYVFRLTQQQCLLSCLCFDTVRAEAGSPVTPWFTLLHFWSLCGTNMAPAHWVCLHCVTLHPSWEDYPHPRPCCDCQPHVLEVGWSPGRCQVPLAGLWAGIPIPLEAQHHSVPLLCFLKPESQPWRKLVDTTLWHIKASWEDVNIWSGAYLAHLFSRPWSRSSEQSWESKGNSFVRIRNSLNAFSSLELSSLPNWC